MMPYECRTTNKNICYLSTPHRAACKLADQRGLIGKIRPEYRYPLSDQLFSQLALYSTRFVRAEDNPKLTEIERQIGVVVVYALESPAGLLPRF